MHLKISSAEWRPLFSGRNELTLKITTEILYSVIKGPFLISTAPFLYLHHHCGIYPDCSHLSTPTKPQLILIFAKSSSSSYFTVDLFPFRSKKIGSHGFQRTMVVLSKKVIDWYIWRSRKTTLLDIMLSSRAIISITLYITTFIWCVHYTYGRGWCFTIYHALNSLWLCDPVHMIKTMHNILYDEKNIVTW